MGAQQVLRTAACALLIAGPAFADGWGRTSPRLHESVAVIDLGPPDEQAHHAVVQAAIDAGLDPVTGDDNDAVALAAAMQEAEHTFGRLDCKGAVAAARRAIGLAAQRQAAGLPVPELTHAWAYVLLCADKNGDTNAATLAATRLRALGGSTDIDATLMARYPDVDALSNREIIAVDVAPEVPNATIYVDFAPASGTHLVLTAGEHVIAAAAGTRRGYVAGPAVPSQKQVAIPMPDQAGPYAVLASVKGNLPAAPELAAVLAQVHVRVALIRHDDVVEAWGHAAPSLPVLRFGGGAADKAAQLVADRVTAWNEHAPDPDQPLLVEDVHLRAEKKTKAEAPTQWWVYATIGGALLAGAIVIYAHEHETDTQRVELHYP